MKILITGGAGFIGSHLIRRLLNTHKESEIFNLDALTYAGNLENLKDIEDRSNYTFIKGNILDKNLLMDIFKAFDFDGVIHLAAESHVDRSIQSASAFVQTNIQGTVNVLEAAKAIWKKETPQKRFYHVSTDEVFGSLGGEGNFSESSPYAPNSPYSASKAASDHFVRSYGATYGLPYMISNCSNNYGPNQFPEKLIPLFINNIIKEQNLPIYGDGRNIRDWLYVEDHVAAIDLVFHKGRTGETYCIGGDTERKNIDLARTLCTLLDNKLGRRPGTSEKLITFIKDRPGHDLRYAIDASKIKSELSWQAEVQFREGLEKTIDWYMDNPTWLKNVTSGVYQEYYQRNYGEKGIRNNQGP